MLLDHAALCAPGLSPVPALILFPRHGWLTICWPSDLSFRLIAGLSMWTLSLARFSRLYCRITMASFWSVFKLYMTCNSCSIVPNAKPIFCQRPLFMSEWTLDMNGLNIQYKWIDTNYEWETLDTIETALDMSEQKAVWVVFSLDLSVLRTLHMSGRHFIRVNLLPVVILVQPSLVQFLVRIELDT